MTSSSIRKIEVAVQQAATWLDPAASQAAPAGIIAEWVEWVFDHTTAEGFKAYWRVAGNEIGADIRAFSAIEWDDHKVYQRIADKMPELLMTKILAADSI